MIFTNVTFFLFFAIVLLALAATQLSCFERRVSLERARAIRRYILLVASYVFYGWGDWRLCLLLFFLTATTYFSAAQIQKGRNVRVFRWIGVAAPLVVLGVFKYFHFFVDSFAAAFGFKHPGAFTVLISLGVSFYSFRALSYVIDVSRQKVKASNSLSKVALYIAFFPQIVAGPIAKARDFLPQLDEDRRVRLRGLADGFQIFLIGAFKKLVIADRLAIFVDCVYGAPLAFDGATVLLAIATYAIQIYFDFSGYSDMAIGIAKCLGFDSPRNFNLPYLSKNPTEFWKRWHISLSSWLMEYLYFSLGGNRKGTVRTYVNLMTTMVLGGLWHGANWTFVVWGALHGAALCVHKSFKAKGWTRFFPAPLSIVLIDAFAAFCWVFFRAESFDSAFNILSRLFVWNKGVSHPYSWSWVALVVVAICSAVAVIRSRRLNKKNGTNEPVDSFCPTFDLSKFWALVAVATLFYLVLGFAYDGENPFIYAQF